MELEIGLFRLWFLKREIRNVIDSFLLICLYFIFYFINGIIEVKNSFLRFLLSEYGF